MCAVDLCKYKYTHMHVYILEICYVYILQMYLLYECKYVPNILYLCVCVCVCVYLYINKTHTHIYILCKQNLYVINRLTALHSHYLVLLNIFVVLLYAVHTFKDK